MADDLIVVKNRDGKTARELGWTIDRQWVSVLDDRVSPICQARCAHEEGRDGRCIRCGEVPKGIFTDEIREFAARLAEEQIQTYALPVIDMRQRPDGSWERRTLTLESVLEDVEKVLGKKR